MLRTVHRVGDLREPGHLRGIGDVVEGRLADEVVPTEHPRPLNLLYRNGAPTHTLTPHRSKKGAATGSPLFTLHVPSVAKSRRSRGPLRRCTPGGGGRSSSPGR